MLKGVIRPRLPGAPVPAASKSLLQKANAARDASDFAAAARLYKTFLAEHPDNGPIHVQAGHMHKEVGLMDEAGRHYTAAAKLMPDDVDLQIQLGHFHKVCDRLEEAVAAYARAVELEPENQTARNELRETEKLLNAPAAALTPRMVMLARIRMNRAPEDYLRNVPAASFGEALAATQESQCYYLLDGVEQRFPDPELSDADMVACLRLCLQVGAIDTARRVAIAVLSSNPQAMVPLDLVSAALEQPADQAGVVALPLQAQIAMLGAATNVIARQRTIIENFVG